MQKHIEWLKATIEIAEEQYPILVNTLKLCLNDVTQKLEMEKQQIIDACKKGYGSTAIFRDKLAEQYYNETFKSK